jgi:hypothetical protein
MSGQWQPYEAEKHDGQEPGDELNQTYADPEEKFKRRDD